MGRTRIIRISFFVKTSVVMLVALLATAGCSSTSSEPRFLLAQPRRASSIPIIARVSVSNTPHDVFTVDRIDVSPVGVGPYDIASTAIDSHHPVQIGRVATSLVVMA